MQDAEALSLRQGKAPTSSSDNPTIPALPEDVPVSPGVTCA